MRFTTAEVADVTGGEVFGRPTEVDGVSIDSRQVQAGELFVPMVAERDGHDFIGAALSAGAPAYLTSGPIEAGTAIRVADTAAALQALGAYARRRLPDRVVGITGSVGKTSLKDLLAAAVGATWSTTASVGSFNNELGVPLTLTNAPEGTECTIVEMGARGLGHIAMLCGLARPTIGIVTMVAGVHLEQFRTIDDVAQGKSELVASLPAHGTAVLNADDERVAAMASRTDAQVVTFGTAGAGDVQAEAITLDDELHPSFQLRSPWGNAAVRLGVAGGHQVTNAVGAAAAALAMGASVESVAEGLGRGRLSAMRMDLRRTASGALVLDDSYNANPTSMRGALEALAALPVRRRIAVLGTMHELGHDRDALHAATADHARQLGVTVISVSEDAYGIAEPDAVDDVGAALDRLHALGLADGDAVLVKASRSAGLDAVAAALRAGS